VLKGINDPARKGIMKAFWDARDYAAMDKAPLEFPATDIDFMREALRRLRAAPTSAATVSAMK